MSQQSDFPDPRLGKTLALMVNDFVGTCKQFLNLCSVPPNWLSDEFRRRTFTLISRAFACLQVAEAQRLLGMGQKDVLASELDSRLHTIFIFNFLFLPEVANDNRWQFDSANDVLRPVDTSLPALVATKPGLSQVPLQGFVLKCFQRHHPQ